MALLRDARDPAPRAHLALARADRLHDGRGEGRALRLRRRRRQRKVRRWHGRSGQRGGRRVK